MDSGSKQGGSIPKEILMLLVMTSSTSTHGIVSGDPFNKKIWTFPFHSIGPMLACLLLLRWQGPLLAPTIPPLSSTVELCHLHFYFLVALCLESISLE